MAKKKPAASKKKTAKKTRSSSAAGSRKKSTGKKTAAGSSAKSAGGAKSPAKKAKTAARTSSRAKASSAQAAKKKKTSSQGKPTRKSARSAASSAKTTKKSATTTRPARRKAPSAPAGKAQAEQKRSDAASVDGETAEEKSTFEQSRPALADAKAIALRFAAAAGLRPVEESAEERALLASRGSKRLSKSPLRKRELDHFRRLLLEKRAAVLSDVSAMEEGALKSDRGSLSALTQHMADQGSDEYEQSLSLGLAESQRRLLTEIDEALERIESGTYGICAVLGIAIPKERLEAKPWAKTSLEGARLLDRGLVRDTG